MSISSVGTQTSIVLQQLMNMRAQYNDLARQLSTGQKSANYAGLGLDRGVTVSLNAQLSALSGYGDTIDNVMNRINLMDTALSRMSDISSTVKSAMVQANTTGNSSGAVTAQTTAQTSLDELLGLLNTQAGDRYLFSGRATDQPAVETTDHILNGNGAQAGLKQLISERNQADLGDGMGRLTVSSGGPAEVDVTEDAGTFGMKLASADSTLTGATVTGPAGSPASLGVTFGSNPNEGESITVRFNLPDGTTANLTLTATTESPPGANQFTIGATPADTAANFQAALSSGIGTTAATSLTAASAVAASNDFFAADADHPPQRVDGPPFDTATGMRTGSAADTVIWYTGETGTDPARGTATARVDQSLAVNYGARANEDGIRKLVQNVATLAAVTVTPSDSNSPGLSLALNQRLSTNINDTSGTQSITTIEADLANAQGALSSAKDRHAQTSATLGDFLQQISGVSNEEVGSEILALQTRMQASMQTTAMLFQTSLVNFLK